MKILHISNFVQKHNGRLFWNTAFKVNNGFTRLGHNVLSFSDRDIARNNYLLSSRIGKSHVNKSLISTFNNYHPDLVILGHADLINNNTLVELRKINPKCKFIQWNVDHLTMNNNFNKLINRSNYIDHLFITTGDKKISTLCKNDMKVSFIPNLFDSSIDTMRIFEKETYQYDVFFALSHGVASGILKNKRDERESLLKKIHEDKLIKSNFYGFSNVQPIWGNKFNEELSKCLMGLNINQGEKYAMYSSDRIATYIGNGLLTCIDRESNCTELFSDSEAIHFNDIDELIEKIKYYSLNKEKAKSIAKDGWERGHLNYSSVIICNYIFQKTFNLALDKINWPDLSYS